MTQTTPTGFENKIFLLLSSISLKSLALQYAKDISIPQRAIWNEIIINITMGENDEYDDDDDDDFGGENDNIVDDTDNDNMLFFF